jgi:hypothetical protein
MLPHTDPEHIAISKSKGIKIDWKDGRHGEYGIAYLRDKCPSASCTRSARHASSRARSGQSVSDLQASFKDVGRGTGGEPTPSASTKATATASESIRTIASAISAHAPACRARA